MQKNVKNGMVHFKIIFGKIAGREMLSGHATGGRGWGGGRGGEGRAACGYSRERPSREQTFGPLSDRWHV